MGRGKGGALGEAELASALEYVAAHPEIFEVILTGGDPLAASARRLRAVSERLAGIPHVALLRVHTRAPTAASDLVTTAKLDALQASGKVEAEARIDVNDVARGVAYMASLSLEANVQFMTVMATKMPYIGRG